MSTEAWDDCDEPVEKTKEPTVDGKCCSCGYAGKEETTCDKREDKSHCYHWWDGSEEDVVEFSEKH